MKAFLAWAWDELPELPGVLLFLTYAVVAVGSVLLAVLSAFGVTPIGR